MNFEKNQRLLIMVNSFYLCRKCPFYKNRHCKIAKKDVQGDDVCLFADFSSDLDCRQSAKILSYFQHWRRGGPGLQPNGHLLGLALDVAIRSLRKESKL